MPARLKRRKNWMTDTFSPLKTLRAQSFQVYEDVTIEFGQFTVLIGQGDSGKSTILRAMRAVFLNDGVDEDIRHGEKKATVTLEFEDGVIIEWSKERKKGGCYRMGDQEFSKTGGQVPDPIAAYLGIGSIEVDATTELFSQLSDQHDTPFLLWETGSKRARILGRATRLDTVISAQMLCKKEMDTARRGLEKATTSLTEVEEQLEALPDYAALEREVDEGEGNLQTLSDSLARANKALDLAERLEEVQSKATAVDTGALLKVLDDAATALDVAERQRFLAERIPQLQRTLKELDQRETDNREALTSFQTQLSEACEEAGLCEVCSGLISHEECTG